MTMTDSSTRTTQLTMQEFRRFLRRGEDETIKRAQGEATGSAGGYAVPDEVATAVVVTLDKHSVVRSVADHLETATAGKMVIPTEDDTGNEASIVGENVQQSNTDLTLGAVNAGAFPYSTGVTRVSFQLLDDSGVDLANYLGLRLGRRIARRQNRDFTTGTGASQPSGLVPTARVGVTCASASAITAAELLDMPVTVDPAYRELDDECSWMMNDATFRIVRNTKDADGEPLWDKVNRRLADYRVTINNHMPSIATGARPILFGNYRAGFLVRDVAGVSVRRLSERYADYLQVGLIGFQRADGFVQDGAAYSALKMG